MVRIGGEGRGGRSVTSAHGVATVPLGSRGRAGTAAPSSTVRHCLAGAGEPRALVVEMRPPLVQLCLLAALVPLVPTALAVSAYDGLVQQSQPLNALNFILRDPPGGDFVSWKHAGDLPPADPSITAACESV